MISCSQSRCWAGALSLSIFFKLSQDFKSRRAGVELIKLLSRLNVCCSDKPRYDRENAVVAIRRDD